MLKRIRPNKKKGFTLIELIVVMAVLAVLVLLAAPKFLGHTKEAQFTKHINNAKVLEDASERYYIDHGKWPRGLDEDVYAAEEVDAYAERIYDITGKEIVLEEGNYWDIDYSALSSYAKLPDESERANYVLRNPVGKVFYLEGLTEEGFGRVTVVGREGQTPVEESKEPSIPNHYVLATDADFKKDTDGNLRYVGTDEYVIIPDVVQGVPVTSYQRMFLGSNYRGVTSSIVKGVVSTNPNVTNMRSMFSGSKSTKLDLPIFNTSNVTNMNNMFSNSQASTLDLRSFDTSNAIDMSFMFNNTYATNIDVSSFNTSRVTNMGGMFSDSKATALDLRSFNTAKVTVMTNMFSNSQATDLVLTSFDTSNVTTMTSMFSGSKTTILDLGSFSFEKSPNMEMMFSSAAARTGYARTEADAQRLNNSSYKVSGLKFIVKP